MFTTDKLFKVKAGLTITKERADLLSNVVAFQFCVICSKSHLRHEVRNIWITLPEIITQKLKTYTE